VKSAQSKAKPARLPRRDPGDLYWIGTNIFRLRTEKKLSQVALAEKAGITARALRSLESAETDANPTLKTLGGVARALGIETVDLYARRKGDLGAEI
jgi:transcriptional regulator with XRE-family HTH domain